VLHLTEIVTHPQSRIHPKNFSSEHQLFPEAGFVHFIFKTTLYERLFLPAEMGVRELLPTRHGCRTGSASPRALICTSNQVLVPGLCSGVCLPIHLLRSVSHAGGKCPGLDFF